VSLPVSDDVREPWTRTIPDAESVSCDSVAARSPSTRTVPDATNVSTSSVASSEP